MSITTNKYLNKVVIRLGEISNGKLKDASINLLYFVYRLLPPKHVKDAKKYYFFHKKEMDEVRDLLADATSKEIYDKMIQFRSTYDMRIHPQYSLDDIYFVQDIIKLSEEESFIDCGAFDGDSIEKFMKNAKCFKNIVAFEPDSENFDKLVSRYGNNSGEECKISLFKAGVWKEKKQLYFKADGNEASKISDADEADGLVVVDVEKIDDIMQCNEATYIKMDIEGSEMAALEGAKDTILRNKPKLAISIYHKDEDMIKIPLYIHSLVPEYRMYVRQHSHSYFDTVLYCIK